MERYLNGTKTPASYLSCMDESIPDGTLFILLSVNKW